MKVMALLAEQLVEDEDCSEVFDNKEFKKIKYQDISFCQECQSGSHVTHLFEEFYLNERQESCAKKRPSEGHLGTLQFKCIHGKKVLTVGNSARTSLKVSYPDEGPEKREHVSTRNDGFKDSQGRDERGKGEEVKKVQIHRYNRNLFRSSGSFDNLKEENINKNNLINLRKIKLGEEKKKQDLEEKGNKFLDLRKEESRNESSGQRMDNPHEANNKISKILFEIHNNTESTKKRRTSLDNKIMTPNSFEFQQRNKINFLNTKNKKCVNQEVTKFRKERKTVSEKKIPNFERCRTFEIDGTFETQTMFSEKHERNTSKDRKLNMRMNVEKQDVNKLNLSNLPLRI
jgi:hypothetical protein